MNTAKAQLEAEGLRSSLAKDELDQATERFNEGLGDNLGGPGSAIAHYGGIGLIFKP